jgi:hypothetical protein
MVFYILRLVGRRKFRQIFLHALLSVCKLIHDDRPLIRLGCYLSFAPGAAALVHQQNGNLTIIAKKV